MRQVSAISVGDVVVVQHKPLSLGFWNLGFVDKLFRGWDGVAITALVRLASRNGKGPSYAVLFSVYTH